VVLLPPHQRSFITEVNGFLMPQASLEAFYAACAEFHSPYGKCVVHFCRNISEQLRQYAFSSYRQDLRPFGTPFGMRPFSGLKIFGLICRLAFANQHATISLNEIHPAPNDDLGLRPTSSFFALGSNPSAPFVSFQRFLVGILFR
jgi:hypothetical protein